ncbi:MAG TPA: hypothetical protein ENH46_01000 [Candidatus Pacearchaeota archaeon]|nr:hypothetical protein [Candidatus Pacearchaeota archaeon]
MVFSRILGINKEYSSKEDPPIIGGGYEHFINPSNICTSWGEANCSNDKGRLIVFCPNNYTKFNMGESREDPESSSDIEKWFICVR